MRDNPRATSAGTAFFRDGTKSDAGTWIRENLGETSTRRVRRIDPPSRMFSRPFARRPRTSHLPLATRSVFELPGRGFGYTLSLSMRSRQSRNFIAFSFFVIFLWGATTCGDVCPTRVLNGTEDQSLAVDVRWPSGPQRHCRSSERPHADSSEFLS